MAMKRVRWKSEDLGILAKEINRLRQLEGGNNLPISKLIFLAQEILPLDRQMAKSSIYSHISKKTNVYTSLSEALENPPLSVHEEVEMAPFELFDSQEDPGKTAPTSSSVPTFVEMITALGAKFQEEQREMVRGELQTHVTRLRDLIRSEIDAALGEAFRKLAGASHSSPQAPVSPPHVTAVGTLVTPGMRGPRVDIVGLFDDLRHLVKTAVGEQFTLRFLTVEECERSSTFAPVVIVCRKFISHGVTEKLKRSNTRVFFAQGGAHSVIKVLEVDLKVKASASR